MIFLLHPFGMRLTTWLLVGVFAILAVRRRDSAPLAACWVWLVGFEATYDVTRALMGTDSIERRLPIIALTLITIPWFTWHGIRPAWKWLAVTAVLWSVWVTLGLPHNDWVNGTVTHEGGPFDLGGELLNVAAKTTWALAYLLPLLLTDRECDRHEDHGVPDRVGELEPSGAGASPGPQR